MDCILLGRRQGVLESSLTHSRTRSFSHILNEILCMYVLSPNSQNGVLNLNFEFEFELIWFDLNLI